MNFSSIKIANDFSYNSSLKCTSLALNLWTFQNILTVYATTIHFRIESDYRSNNLKTERDAI